MHLPNITTFQKCSSVWLKRVVGSLKCSWRSEKRFRLFWKGLSEAWTVPDRLSSPSAATAVVLLPTKPMKNHLQRTRAHSISYWMCALKAWPLSGGRPNALRLCWKWNELKMISIIELWQTASTTSKTKTWLSWIKLPSQTEPVSFRDAVAVWGKHSGKLWVYFLDHLDLKASHRTSREVQRTIHDASSNPGIKAYKVAGFYCHRQD